MKVNIRPHVEFCINGEADLYASIQVDWDEHFVEKLNFEDMLKRQLRGLTKAEKADCKKRITDSVKKFLATLES